MTTQDVTLDLAEASTTRWRRYGVIVGRILLIAGLFVGWKIGADAVGPVFVADPIKVVQRIIEDTQSGVLLKHIYATLRISAIGFVIGCFFGVALPFVLRRLPRVTDAVEPYIMASVGVPKYALIPLFILYFGIDDAPKLWLIGLLVFYPVFIAIFAGIRNVDRRLINMALIVGASESKISREVIWKSLTSFFFAALKISLPRAVSAAIIGEFLVGNEGVGFFIENSRQSFDTVGAFAGILVATALVLVINTLLDRVDRRVNAWRPTERSMQI